jgi:hypothetical protein
MKASGAISISPALQRAFDNAGVHQIVKGVVNRPQIGIDFFAQVAGKKTKPLAGFHRRPRQDDAVDLLALEQLHGMGDGKPGLAGARRTGAEHERVALERPDIGVLRRGARAHRTLAQVDLFEGRPRGGRVVIEQRALRDRLPNSAFHVPLRQIVSALELLVEAFQHAARLLAAAA